MADGSSLPESLFRRLVPEVDHRTVGEILAHPGFGRMRRFYITASMANYEIAMFPGGWQGAAYRGAAISAIVCLWAAYDVADRATWPTLTRLKRSVSNIGLSSPRQLDDFIRRLIETGHIIVERAASDGRLRLLKPTEKLLTWDREVIRPCYDALQLLYPEPGYGLGIACAQDFHLAQRRCALDILPVIGAFPQANVNLLPVYNMYQGLPVLLYLADRHATDPGTPVRERDLADLQHRLGVSRSHIRNIVVAAEAGGLVTWTAGSGRSFAATPRALAAADLFIANTLASHDLTYRLALDRIWRDTGIPVR